VTCGLERLVALGFSLGVPWGTTEIPTGSLVHRIAGHCDGVMVEIVSVNRLYLRGMPPPEGTGCVDPAGLQPALRFLALADHGPYKAGDLVGHLPEDCDAHLADYTALRPIRDEELAAVDRVREAYQRDFGPIGREEIPYTDWGYVGLPMEFYSPARRDAEILAEHLDTPERATRAAIAAGPGGAYYHFAGADSPDTDRFGRPETIAAFLDLAKGWFAACTAHDSAARCAIGVGDIAYFAPLRPDPLGHKDHWEGECADIRLFRSDGSRYEAYWNQPDDRTGKVAYDWRLTRDFVAFARATAPVDTVYFDDPRVLTPMRGKPRKKHPDHVHLCFDRH
jgi:hypothetical protein